MVSFDTYLGLGAAALLAAAAVSVPRMALAQAASGSASDTAALGELADRISEAQLEGGAYSSRAGSALV